MRDLGCEGDVELPRSTGARHSRSKGSASAPPRSCAAAQRAISASTSCAAAAAAPSPSTRPRPLRSEAHAPPAESSRSSSSTAAARRAQPPGARSRCSSESTVGRPPAARAARPPVARRHCRVDSPKLAIARLRLFSAEPFRKRADRWWRLGRRTHEGHKRALPRHAAREQLERIERRCCAAAWCAPRSARRAAGAHAHARPPPPRRCRQRRGATT